MSDDEDEVAAVAAPPPPPPHAVEDDHVSRSSRARASTSLELFKVQNPPSKRAKGGGKQKMSSSARNEVTKARMATLPSAPIDIPTSILDSRHVTDPDESYSENEKALSEFLKLHPMLRWRATRTHAHNVWLLLSQVQHQHEHLP